MNRLYMLPTAGLITGALSSRLYADRLTALAELIYNGFDAATRRQVQPTVNVQMWAAGEHPLSLTGPALSILDNGTGFTDEVLAAYGRVGESVHVGAANLHGTHGLGKLACFALAPKVNGRYFIITSTGGANVWMYEIDSNVFREGGFLPKRVKTPIPGIPDRGPFTMILVPDTIFTMEPAEVRSGLHAMLPIRPWTVTVQGEEVVPREFSFQRSIETPAIPSLGGTVVAIDLGTTEQSGDRDAVHLVDSSSGRFVTDLGQLPRGVRRKLHVALLHPRLMGVIRVAGLEKQSSAGRSGLDAGFWGSPFGEGLLDVLNTFGADTASELLGKDAPAEQPFDAHLKDVIDTLTRSFGEPEQLGPPTGGVKPPGGGGGGGSGGGGGGKPGGARPPRGDLGGGEDRPSGGFLGVTVRVEGSTYRVLSFPTSSSTPTVVRKGSIIVINTVHCETVRILKLGKEALRRELLRILIEAHVAESNEGDTQPFARVYELLGRCRV